MSPNRNYEAGVRLERDARVHLEREGYVMFRTAGSKGKADLIGFKPGQIILVQAKRNGTCPSAERAELRRIAAMVGAVPLVAFRPRVQFRELTGDGPKEWREWVADEVEG